MSSRLPNLPDLADLLDILPDAVVMVDAKGLIGFANPAVHLLLGYRESEIVGRPLAVLIPPEVRERHEAMVDRYRCVGAPMMMGQRPVLHAMHKGGRLVPVSTSLCNLAIGGGERVSVAVIHDVSTLRTHLDRATQMAETDALTGIGNRLRLSRRMHALLASERAFALLYIDLTAFKPLNDRLGHGAGDQALRVVAGRLQGETRKGDLAARLGGDEFVLLFDGLDDAAALATRAAATIERIAGPLRIGDAAPDSPIRLGANLGGAIHPRHGRTEKILLAAADAAMYAAKQAGVAYRLADDA
jgi:diguanylate cyclase (GGDEF)-like protein/PAS domain S-box-containing protein